MIQKETYLNIIDNSGASIGKCIHVYTKSKKKVARLGDFVKVSIRKFRKKGLIRVKKDNLYLGLVVQTKKNKQLKNGQSKNFNKNSIILLTPNKKILGTRVLNFIDYELRYKFGVKALISSFKFL